MRLTRDGHMEPDHHGERPMGTREVAAFLAQFGARTDRIVVRAGGMDFDIRDLVYSKTDNVIRIEVGEHRPPA